MKIIYIIGAGGFSKEVCLLINQINSIKPSFQIKGFLDLIPKNSCSVINVGQQSYEVFNQEDIFDLAEENQNISFAVGIGSPQVLKKILLRIKSHQLPNLIHPSATVDLEHVQLGYGNIITAGSRFTTNIHVGHLNIFNLNTTVGHDTKIGDCNVFNPGVHLSGGLEIGSFNLVGTGAVILQNLKMGNDSILGAGAAMVKNLDSNLTAVGIPAKRIN